jgi:hypothetical protein
MSLLTALANFVCNVLILFIQYLNNYHFHTEIQKELSVALVGWQPHSQTISYLLLNLQVTGYQWDVYTEMWPANIADISALNAAEIINNTPTATYKEIGFLQDDEKLFHFEDARLHCQMQSLFWKK